MAKINVLFDNIDYSIDEYAFADASAELKSHLSSVMNGSGSVIDFDGLSYSIDSVKLQNATTDFVQHLGTIYGSGRKVVVGGVEYGIDSAKTQDAIDDLHDTLGELKEIEEPITLATASWEKIAEISQSGQAANYFSIGETKTLTLTDVFGNTEEITVAIADFNHDDLADGSGKAGITFVAMTLPKKTTAWGSDYSGCYYYDPYNSKYTSDSLVHYELEGGSFSIMTQFPSDLRKALKTVNKIYDKSYTKGDTDVHGFKVWALSLDELGCDSNTSGYKSANYDVLGERYPIFPVVKNYTTLAQMSNKLPIAYDASGKAVGYHTRHGYKTSSGGSSVRVIGVTELGTYNMLEGQYVTTKTAYNLRFGFCV
jgi:hypothetical protein